VLTELEIWVIVWCAFALGCGGLIKGALGVGTPLLTVPLMALVLPVQLAVALMAIPVVMANSWQAVQADRTKTVLGRLWPAFIAVFVGTWIGVEILVSIDERALLLVVGVAVIVFALVQGSSRRLVLPNRLVKPAGVVFGLASGVIGGLSSMFGPMLILYLLSVRDLAKDQFVSSISFLYLSAVVPWTIILYIYGVLDAKTLLYSSAATVPVALGMMVGQHLRQRISEQRFQKLVLAVLLGSGGTMLWRAVN
jgi:uncharacterized protein